MENRREQDLHMNTVIEILNEIKITQEEHGYVIKRNRDDIEGVRSDVRSHITEEEGKINGMESKLDKLYITIEPVIDLMHDIAAVGKFGHWLKQAVIWLAIVGGAFVATYEYIRHFGDKP